MFELLMSSLELLSREAVTWPNSNIDHEPSALNNLSLYAYSCAYILRLSCS